MQAYKEGFKTKGMPKVKKKKMGEKSQASIPTTLFKPRARRKYGRTS